MGYRNTYSASRITFPVTVKSAVDSASEAGAWGDMGEIWGDMGEIWGDMGERWGDMGEIWGRYGGEMG